MKNICNPKIFLTIIFISTKICICQQSVQAYTLGVEAIPPELIKSLRTTKISLITNQTGKDSQCNRTIDLLILQGLKPTLILVPEHGLEGKIAAGIEVADTIDQKTGIPVMSLYSHGTGKNIDQKILNHTDLFLIDLQDCGMRHFTYISTLYKVLEACALHKKKIIVLDRPNPLGAIMEGPLVEHGLYSFISIASIPVRHGMTIGELALYFNSKVLPKPAQLKIISMKNYDRTQGMYGKLLAPLSPNIQSIQACYGYSFLGILGEFKPFEIGIKTGAPFQIIMLPEKNNFECVDWSSLALKLKTYGINSIIRRIYIKSQKTWFSGLQLQIPNIGNVSAFQTLLTILDFAKASGVNLTLSALGNKAVGTKKLHAYLEGTLTHDSLIKSVNNGLNSFYKKAQNCFLYQPWPKVVMLQ